MHNAPHSFLPLLTQHKQIYILFLISQPTLKKVQEQDRVNKLKSVKTNMDKKILKLESAYTH